MRFCLHTGEILIKIFWFNIILNQWLPCKSDIALVSCGLFSFWRFSLLVSYLVPLNIYEWSKEKHDVPRNGHGFHERIHSCVTIQLQIKPGCHAYGVTVFSRSYLGQRFTATISVTPKRVITSRTFTLKHRVTRPYFNIKSPWRDSEDVTLSDDDVTRWYRRDVTYITRSHRRDVTLHDHVTGWYRCDVKHVTTSCWRDVTLSECRVTPAPRQSGVAGVSFRRWCRRGCRRRNISHQ